MATGGITGVGTAGYQTEVGTGHPYAVVRPFIDHHVGLFGHVALDAQGAVAGFALVDLLVEVMVVTVVGLAQMTLQTEVVALELELQAVGIVAVAAADIVVEHLALHERPVDVDLVEDLPVGVIQALVKGRRGHVLQHGNIRMVVAPQDHPPRVTGSAQIDQVRCLQVTGGHGQT